MYLVGGAVRDLILSKKIKDLDFVIVGVERVIPIARRIADTLSASVYPMDKERDIARIIIHAEQETRIFLDFAALRGENIEQDLAGRDFTINAIAIDTANVDHLIDPLQGLKDAHQKILRVCSSESLSNDPVRVLRAVRLAIQLDFRIATETIQLMKQAISSLGGVSPERLRDEIFRLLDNKHVDATLRILENLGILPYIFPETSALMDLHQSSPHTLDVWDHTLSVLQKMEQVLFILGVDANLEEAGNIVSSWISLNLGRYRKKFSDHFSKEISPERSIRSLLFMAAIYHDAGKAHTQSIDAQGQIHFYQHEQISRKQIMQRARFLRLSSQEINRLATVVENHLRPLLLNRSSQIPTKRAIYKFWRDLGDAGVDVCLLSVADLLGTYGPNLSSEILTSHLTTVRTLLDAWWEQRQVMVSPPSLIRGGQIISELGLEEGPTIGKIIEAIRLAQVEGKVTTYNQALDLARDWIRKNSNTN